MDSEGRTGLESLTSIQRSSRRECLSHAGLETDPCMVSPTSHQDQMVQHGPTDSLPADLRGGVHRLDLHQPVTHRTQGPDCQQPALPSSREELDSVTIKLI